MMTRYSLRFGVTAILTILSSGAASAQVTSPLEPVLQCRSIEDDTARLSCFDREAASLSARAEEIVTVDRREIEAVERESFGLQLPRLSLGFLGGRGADARSEGDDLTSSDPSSVAEVDPDEVRVVERDPSGQIDRVEIGVDRIERIGFDTIRVHTRNGQVWEIIDRVGQRPIRARDDSFVTISRASLGSYLMQLDGRGRLYRVTRLR